MEFDHRKLLLITKRDSKECPKKCFKLNNICMDDDDCEKELKKLSEESHLDESQMARKSLLITGSLVSAVFLFCLVFMIAKRYFARRNAAASNRRFGERNVPILFDTQENFLDEEHGPIVDHHVWYINTVGLPQAVIDSISICKYKRGDGLIECTECSVCLSEFDEEESLRLLPKCSHAFHVSCIDTWLRAHKSCPLCRAPIVCASAEEGDLRPTQESGRIESSESLGGAVNMVEQGESSGAREARVEADPLGSSGSRVGPIRRSVSMEAVKGSNLVALSKRMRSSSAIGVSSQRVTGSIKIVRSGSSGRRVFGSKHRRTQSSIIVA